MSNASVEQFYDDFSHKLIVDYMTGNRRMEEAIRYAIGCIPESAQAILDIGCGIGWSTHELATHYPDKKVDAVDLSAGLLRVAETLFARENISFSKTDITSATFGAKKKYDAVLMLDVYEHIPVGHRATFHRAVDQLLNPQGVVILTCPSKYHQQWLRTQRPDGLQPVDEDVTLNELTVFAQAIRGDILDFSYLSIWQQYDYSHTLLQKEAGKWAAGAKVYTVGTDRAILEAFRQRAQRVQQSQYAADFSTQREAARAKAPKPGTLSKILNKLR